jgi:ubiquinone/menaquinone biosynthesis C-methylase UbiE
MTSVSVTVDSQLGDDTIAVRARSRQRDHGPFGRIREMDDGERTARQYDAMAADYAPDNAVSPYNAFYERPATMALLGNVAGLRALEVGCGSGVLTTWLVDQGAVVTAMDVSPVMLGLARQSVGDRADLVLADLAAPLPFETAAFDIVVASLVLHYVLDWTCALGELRRVLGPGGAVVFSTHHPTMDWALCSPDDYFAIKQVTDTWTIGGRDFEVTFWRRPLTAMCEAIADAGFVIERLVEPAPSLKVAERDAEAYQEIKTKPRFLFFRLRPT